MKMSMLMVCAMFSLAAAAEEVEPTPLLILDFKHAAADADTARVINELVATAASKGGKYAVTTGADLTQALDLEAEKTAMGCGDTSCLAEIAGAMGADLVVFGDVGKLGETFIINLNLFDNNAGSSVGRESVRSARLDELPPLVEDATEALLGGQAPPTSPLLVPGAVTAAAGVTLAVVGFSVAAISNEELRKREVDADDKENALLLGQIFFWTGVVGVVVTGAGAGMSAMGALE